MSDIKSTLDLVMERTRHLSLSDEEKQSQKDDVLKKRIQGLVQKYLDQSEKIETLKKVLAKWETSHGEMAKKMFRDDVLYRIDFDQNNGKLFLLLKEICGLETSRFISVIDSYLKALGDQEKKRRGEIRADLLKNRFISGPAIVPNLASDAVWSAEVEKLRRVYGKILQKEIENIARKT